MRARELLLTAVAAVAAASSAHAQFRDDFDRIRLAADRAGLDGWSAFTGDGEAAVDLRQLEPGVLSVLVDASRDRRNVWWALIKRQVSDGLDLARLAAPGHELRLEARIRVSQAPRRVNLHLNTQRTTDFHSHLMEFDIPDAVNWHTISLTTRGFDARPGDTVAAQLALMDWGHETSRVDVDYVQVTIVDAAHAPPDAGERVPYHPPVPDPAAFERTLAVAGDTILDVANPDVNLNDWSSPAEAVPVPLLTVSGTQHVILRFDLSRLAGRTAAGAGLLELTTHSLQRTTREIKDFGLVRVVEIAGGDPGWDQRTVTLDRFAGEEPLARLLNPQPIIDWPAAARRGERTFFTIPRPVLQRLLDGRTQGLALRALGALHASFYASEHPDEARRPRLLLNVE